MTISPRQGPEPLHQYGDGGGGLGVGCGVQRVAAERGVRYPQRSGGAGVQQGAADSESHRKLEAGGGVSVPPLLSAPIRLAILTALCSHKNVGKD